MFYVRIYIILFYLFLVWKIFYLFYCMNVYLSMFVSIFHTNKFILFVFTKVPGIIRYMFFCGWCFFIPIIVCPQYSVVFVACLPTFLISVVITTIIIACEYHCVRYSLFQLTKVVNIERVLTQRGLSDLLCYFNATSNNNNTAL